ncbi:hypothetical protein Chor_013325, partial [Crotalus horridus]
SGLIRTQENDFLISPLPQHLAQELHYKPPAGHHPHVLYKRTAEEKVLHRYKVDSNPYHFPLDRHSNLTAHKYHIPANDYHHGRFQKQHFCGRRKKYSPKPPTEDTFVLSDEYGSQARLKRSPVKNQKGGSLNVETLVVADRKMLEKHSKENVTTYILTVMNMVSSLFKDGTIGSDINIVVVSLLLLEQEPGGLVINHHADQSLNSFCQWQSALVGKNGKRHDHAILLTGFDICSWKNEPCFAPISGMCSKYRSCTINEDTGLGLAFTIAHESGHNTAQAACLIDEPKQAGQYKYPDKLPGQIYDADTQCKWQFGAKAKLCNLSFVKWCRRGQCVPFGDHGPKPVNGQWSAWSVWSDCSRTCGGGVTYQERHCNNPKPQHGGKFCQGSSRIYQLCNTQLCASNSPDFRAQQCAEYNSKPFRGWYYKWKPYTKVEGEPDQMRIDFEEDRCKLYCTAEDFDFFFAMSNRVKDGTLCSLYKEDVCIDGVCEQVGCDYRLGSKAALDACGVCKGDNSSCTFYSGHYLTQHKTNNYYPIVTIPAGARSIEIQELLISSSYLAVRNLNKKYYLTKDWTVDWPGKFYFAGTMFDYQRPFSHPEKLSASGPTNETLIFEVSVNNENKILTKRHSYSWVMVQSDCSATCGGGEAFDSQSRVFTGSSNSCKFFILWPKDKTLNRNNDVQCKSLPSLCSKTCGRGIMKREVSCKSVRASVLTIVPESLCNSETKPEMQQTCVLGRCPKNERLQWVISAWSECSATCGPGIRRREMQCIEKSIGGKLITFPLRRCRNLKKPSIDLEEVCQQGPCPMHPLYNRISGWYSSPWQQCTVTCGGGVQTRSVQCLFQGQPATGCLFHQKPAMSQACNTNFCLAPEKKDDPSCVDFFAWCHLVPQHGVCNHKFYGKQCCKSCTWKN